MHETSSKTVKITGFIIILVVIIVIALVLTKRDTNQEELITETPVINQDQGETPENPQTFSSIINHGDTVTANQVITGSVPGFWFFEGDFPVELVDNNDVVFATVIATSSEDWMTTDIIPFTITTPENLSYTGPGKMIFKRNDPSDGESNIPASETTATILVNFQ